MTSVREHLALDDPLTRETALYLVEYGEEDDRLDYKRQFYPQSEKDWLEITKDISAFANTFGGYLVFGVNDSDKKVLGISRVVADTIKDANRLLQKVNRYLDPPITGLRSKEFRVTNLIVVVVLIPGQVRLFL